MENRGTAPVPLKKELKASATQPWFCFLPTWGSLRFHHTVKVQKLSQKIVQIVPKSHVRIKSHFFAQSKLMRGLPTKFTSSRTKSVQLKWELQHQRQAKKGHSMSSWDCLLCNCALHIFKPSAWISFSFELQETCMFRPTKIHYVF